MFVESLTPWMPVFNTFHAIGLTLLLGSVVIVSLRLLGLVMRQHPLSTIAKPLNRAIAIGIGVMLVSGSLLFLPEVHRWYASGAFRVKMALLAAAVVFHVTVFRRVTKRNDSSPLLMRTTGAIALMLWYAVGMGGRALTFLGE